MDSDSAFLSDDLAFWRDSFASEEKEYNFSEFDILLLNQNRFVQSLISQVLRGFGVRTVVPMRDSETALAEVEARSFDLLLVDWMVEPLDGARFVRRVRASRNETLRLVPVIMITGHSEQNRVEAARDAGVNEFLALPLAPAVLFDRMVSLIDHPRPFIRTSSFFGPDRRRRSESDHTGPWRRSTDARRAPAAAPAAPPDTGSDGSDAS